MKIRYGPHKTKSRPHSNRYPFDGVRRMRTTDPKLRGFQEAEDGLWSFTWRS